MADDVACLLADDQTNETEITSDDDVSILSNVQLEHNGTQPTGETVNSTENSGDNTESAQEAAAPTASVSRHSRSSSRSRGRRRHRRHHRRRPQFPGLKGKETNFIAAVCNMIVMVAVCTALVEPRWFMVYGGGCRDGDGKPVRYIGMTEFLRAGHFKPVHHSDKQVNTHTKYIYKYGETKQQMLYDCVGPTAVDIIHCVLAFCFIIIGLSLVAFLFDLAGPSNRFLKELRRNAVFNVISVLFCVLVSGFCFWVTEHLYSIQDDTKMHSSSRIEVQFSVSFYIMASAGAMSVLAAACNLLKTNINHYEPRDAANDENNELDMGHDGPAFMPPPPPPPYSP